MEERLKYYKAKLNDADFIRISEFIELRVGIKLPRQKKAMVQNRLYKRLIDIKIETFSEYVKFVFSPKGKDELRNMIDEITTNKTDFFREIKHFDFLEKIVLKNYTNIKVWSAGCSTGEEPYSLAMTIENNNIDYNITATDISGKVLKFAKDGIYKDALVKDIKPDNILKYFEKIKGNKENSYKIKRKIQQNVNFTKLNFRDQKYNIDTNFDMIFFRNVLIYFNIEVQNEVLSKILKHLKIGGYLFIGHSESIYNLKLPLKSVSHSVFQKIY